jgi:hypothetical protein
MIHGTPHHAWSVWLLRVPPRQGGPLFPTQFMPLILTRMTPILTRMMPTVRLKVVCSAPMLRSHPSGRHDCGAIIRPCTKRPG